jgi:hypothetical protein
LEYIFCGVDDTGKVYRPLRENKDGILCVTFQKEAIANAMTKNGFVAVERYNSFNDTIDIHWVLGSIHISFYQHMICISIYHLGEENILY